MISTDVKIWRNAWDVKSTMCVTSVYNKLDIEVLFPINSLILNRIRRQIEVQTLKKYF